MILAGRVAGSGVGAFLANGLEVSTAAFSAFRAKSPAQRAIETIKRTSTNHSLGWQDIPAGARDSETIIVTGRRLHLHRLESSDVVLA